MIGITTDGKAVEIDPEKPKYYTYAAFIVFRGEEVPKWGSQRMFGVSDTKYPPLLLESFSGLFYAT